MDDKAPAIIVKNVFKQFRQGPDLITVLKDVSLHVNLGELLMIVGPSGCGKTTLLSVMGGNLKFDQGEVHLFGQPLHQMKSHKITNFRRTHIGFIFQQYHLIRTLNCLENVSIPLLLNGLSKTEAEELAAKALEKVGLIGKEKTFPRKLSGGQQQRVAIARALVHEPRIIICDEPTAALDAVSGHRILDIMKEAASSPDRCLIVVTHDNRIYKYADRIVQMDDGCIVSQKE